MMLRLRVVSIGCLPLLLICSWLSGAAHGSLTYIFTGIGSGSLGASQFNDAQFRITAVGDETQVTNPASRVFRLNGVSSLLEITGLAATSFTFAPSVFVNQNIQDTNPSIGISDPTQDRAIFIVGAPQLASYDLSSVYPVVEGRAISSSSISFSTSQGLFVIGSSSFASFQAVPEPSATLLLTICGLVGVSLRRRRRAA